MSTQSVCVHVFFMALCCQSQQPAVIPLHFVTVFSSHESSHFRVVGFLGAKESS